MENSAPHLLQKVLATALLLLIATTAVHSAEHHRLKAEKITQENFPNAVRGIAAIAGLDDWLLSNGTLCASISAPAHETYLSYRGGTLVDLGHCGRGDDQWHTYHEMFNMDQGKILPSSTISPVIKDQRASIVVTGRMAGVENQTRYSLSLKNPDRLSIETRLTRLSESERLYLFGALTLHPNRSLTPFVLDSNQFKYSKGFDHPYVDTNDKLGMLKVMFPADLHVLVGAAHIKPEIAYGIHTHSAELIDSQGNSRPLKQFAINNENFTLLGNFTNPLWFDTKNQPGLLQFLQTTVMDLELGETLLLKKEILVSKTADVASITNKIFRGEAIEQQALHPNNRLLIKHKKMGPITYVKPNNANQFTAYLPEGASINQLEITELGNNDNTANGILILPKGAIMHLTFKGINGTPDPKFFPEISGFRVGYEVFNNDLTNNKISLANSNKDTKSILLPEGDYRVYASRGIDYTVEAEEINIQANSTNELVITPPTKIFQTPHWISADLHLHSALSFDSTLIPENRIIDFVAQGGEIMVASEHKYSVDISTYINKLGLDYLVKAIPGVELTGMTHTRIAPHGIGHHNVFPVDVKPQEFLGGTLPHENRRLSEVIGAYKKNNPNNIFQLNHPRGKGKYIDDINFFDHLTIGKSYNSKKLLNNSENVSLLEQTGSRPYRDIDFDAMEVLNGSGIKIYEKVREDWFSLIKQGYSKTATGNSDSHNAATLSAIPRNYVYLDKDNLSDFDRNEFLSSIKHGKLFFTTGPFISVKLGQAMLGEFFSGTQGTLSVNVKSADWCTIDTLNIFLNGEIIQSQKITGAGQYSTEMQFDRDSFINIEIKGKASKIYKDIYPGFEPIAFTNPIWIDADNDGMIKLN